MKMNFLLLLTALFHSGLSLKCYVCHSIAPNKCTLDAKPREEECVIPAYNYKNVCMYREGFDPERKMNLVISKCALFYAHSDNETLPECNVTSLRIKECWSCETDLCNFAPVIIPTPQADASATISYSWIICITLFIFTLC